MPFTFDDFFYIPVCTYTAPELEDLSFSPGIYEVEDVNRAFDSLVKRNLSMDSITRKSGVKTNNTASDLTKKKLV